MGPLREDVVPDRMAGDVFLKKWNNQMVGHLPQSVFIVTSHEGPGVGVDFNPKCAVEETQRARPTLCQQKQ